MKTDKNLLLLGSSYPSFIQNDLIDSATQLGMKIIPADIAGFKSDERFCELYPDQREKFLENQQTIEGANVHIVMNMQDDPNKLFVDAINTIETVKEYGAASIHIVLSFAPFARQDRVFDNRMVSVMAKTFPKHLRCAGADRVTTLDVHSKAAEKFFVDYFGEKQTCFLSAVDEIYKTVQTITHGNVKYGAPDGADKPQDVAQRKARKITRLAYGEVDNLQEHMFGIIKSHTGTNSTEVKEFIGNVHGCDTVMIDDMTDTGGTLINGAFTLKENGARKVIAAITHGIFSENSLEILTVDKINDRDNPIDVLLVTDSILNIHKKVSALPEKQRARVQIVSTTPIIKQALKFVA